MVAYGGAPEALQAKVREELGLGKELPKPLEHNPTPNPKAAQTFWANVGEEMKLYSSEDIQKLVNLHGDIQIVPVGSTNWMVASQYGFDTSDTSERVEISDDEEEDPVFAKWNSLPDAALILIGNKNGIFVDPATMDRNSIISKFIEKGVTA